MLDSSRLDSLLYTRNMPLMTMMVHINKKGGIYKMGELIVGIIVATFGWFVTGFLDLSWIVELFGKLF